MNKYHIEFSKDSKIDLAEIKDYIRNTLQEPEISKKFIAKIKTEIHQLSENPQMYAIIDDDFIKKLEIRKLIVNNYIVFYRIKESEKIVQIVRIVYGKRNWISLL